MLEQPAIRSGLAILALALSLTPAAVAAAAENAAVVGKWSLSMDFQGQPVEITLEITQAEDGALGGTWTSPRGTDSLANVKWDGQELTFTRTLERQGQTFDVQHSATIEGDSMTGKMVLPQREIPFSGKRAA
jgi:hypothetical protein